MFCFVVVIQSFIMNSHEVFIHIHQGCFAGTGAIVRLPQCQWSKPDGYGKTSQCITTTKHSKAKPVCIFLGIYCMKEPFLWEMANMSQRTRVIVKKYSPIEPGCLSVQATQLLLTPIPPAKTNRNQNQTETKNGEGSLWIRYYSCRGCGCIGLGSINIG